jgi:hypothetical protein
MFRLLAAGLFALSGTVFTMCDGGPVPPGCCESGDQLNVVYHPGEPTVQDVDRCDHWGGELIFDPVANTSTCEHVDF